MSPGRVRFVPEDFLDVEGAADFGGRSERLGLEESSAERCSRVDADKSPMAEYLTMGVYGVADVWACPPCTSPQGV